MFVCNHKWLWNFLLLLTIQLFGGHIDASAKFVKLNEMAWMRGMRAPSLYNVSTYAATHAASFNVESLHNKGKLAVMVPFPYIPRSGQKGLLDTLHCTLRKLLKHVVHTTESEIFLFVNEFELSKMAEWLAARFPGVHVLPIVKESWHTSSFSNWTVSPYTADPPLVDPYLLSKWKLSFAPDLAKELGFKYMMIVDADAMVMNNLDFHIVKQFTAQRTAMGYRNKTYKANEKNIAGLAELAKFWMINRNILTPPGPLYEHFTPGDIFHIDTASWDLHIFQDAFVIISVDFWHEEPVQNFLHLVFTSGGELLRTWKSESVYTMVRLLFLQDQHVHAFHQNTVLHDAIADSRLYKYLECTVVEDDDYAAIAAHIAETASTTYSKSSDELGATTATGNTGVSNTAVPVPHTLIAELPIMLQSVGVEVLPPAERLRELFLFHWEFSANSCGADTAVVNNYTQYAVEAEVKYLRANLWWHKHRVDAQLDLLANDIYKNFVHSTEQYAENIIPREVCKGILLQQLEAYVRFFCSYGFQGRKMIGYEEGLLRAASQSFEVLWN